LAIEALPFRLRMGSPQPAAQNALNHMNWVFDAALPSMLSCSMDGVFGTHS